jgi:uncharacterized Zn-binding protein involved in type VI secretion
MSARAIALAALATLCLIAPATAIAGGPPPVDLQPLELRVQGGEERWRANPRFVLFWRNPPQAVAAVHYRVLNPTGQVAIAETRIPWAATSLDPIRVPAAPGAYTAEIWLEDAAAREGAPVTAQLRFDNAAPAPVDPEPVAGWIGRAAFPCTARLSHPAMPEPLSGIRGYAISIDAKPNGRPCANSVCSEAEVDLRGGIEEDAIAIGELPEGTSYLHAVAVSGAGVPSPAVGTIALRVDKTDPAAHLSGAPDSWTNRPVTLRVSATDAGSGMTATWPGVPFTAIRVDGSAPTIAAGATVDTTLIESGSHTVAYYARDAAGNVADGGHVNNRPNGAPATAIVRIDREPPRLAFVAAQDPLDPERIEARASDLLSGIDPERGSIAVRRAGSRKPFDELPTESSGSLLRARWDSAAYPAGEYEFHATAFDLAGNAAFSASRAGGSQMRLRGPLKVATKLLTAPAEGPVSLIFGQRRWFGGRLVAGRRAPLAGIPVRVIERFEPGAVPRERLTTVRTGEDGAFGVRLAPGPSRQVEAVVMATATVRGARSEPLALAVHGRLSLAVSSSTARIGGAPIVFRGRVAGAGAVIPADGKVVQLQFRLPGLLWREFRTLRADRHGRFRYAYRFADDDSRGTRFQFRALAPAQAGWPFEPAGSRPVAVRGR